LLFRLPVQKPNQLQFLRAPQSDLSLSLDTRRSRSNPRLSQDLAELLTTITMKPTIRTLTFTSPSDLHKFQYSTTRFIVRYDSPASLFAISRRRMVVPIYKKLETSNCRLQILTQGGESSERGDRKVTQIAAFFDDWSIADSLVFQVRPSDVFEKVKGEKGAKYCVRLVDAKFSLPGKEKHEEVDDDNGVWPRGVKRRFVNLEGLEYAEEHDDVTIGFESESGEFPSFRLLFSSCHSILVLILGSFSTDRDAFCECLPAATTTRKFDLRRKI